jgi:hypothetical protein
VTATTQPQPMQALEVANHNRFARAELKRAIKSGDVRVAEVLLADLPSWLENMTVEELFDSVRGMPLKSRYRIFNATPTNPNQTLRWLTTRQRDVLAECAEAWQGRPYGNRRAFVIEEPALKPVRVTPNSPSQKGSR